MEKYFKASLSFVMLVAVSLAVSCKTENNACTGCCEEPGITKVITFPKTGEKVTLQFYNAITPTNDEFCDYNMTTKNKIDESCRPNFDSIYNDNLNSYFAIGGYDQAVFRSRGLRTYLRIQPVSDTSQIWPKEGSSIPSKYNYMDQGVIFRGESEIQPTYDDRGIIRFYASGRYTYKFLIYDTVAQISDSTLIVINNPFEGVDSLDLMMNDPVLYAILLDEYNKNLIYDYKYGLKKERLMDSVVGTFCIIRNENDCPVSNCIGKDPNDPLLK